MQKKNVLHILRTYSLHGGEKQLSKVLIKNKYFNNTFLDFYNDKKIKNYYSKNKIPYLYLNNFYIKPLNLILELFLSFFFMIYSFKKVAKILNSKKIEIVVCHGIQSAIIIQVVMFFFKKKIKFFYMHRILKQHRSYDFLSRIIYNRFNLILCNSNAVKKSLHLYSTKDKVKVIYNAVEIEKKINFKKNNENIILSIARLEKRKNLLFLKKLFHKFKKKNKNYSLFLIGDGPEKFYLKDYVKRNKILDVNFLGYKKNVKKYLKRCKIFVHTSLFEGMSNAVLEAMALGKASVVLNSPGVAELHVHKKTGFISGKSLSEFTNYLDKLEKNEKLLKIFFKNSRNRVRKKYSIEKTLISYNQYLK